MAWSPNRVPGRRSRPAARSRPGTRLSGSRCGSPASPTSRRRPGEGGVSAVTDADLAVVAEQLGRAARGVCGRPTVVRTAPRLPDGTPFPTTYYLTHPGAVAAISTLEAAGVMQEMTARLADDAELAAAHRRAHQDYLARRAELGEVPEIAGVSAGGMPGRVKCLHALVGHALAAGPGVNPLGDEALALIAEVWRPDRCTC